MPSAKSVPLFHREEKKCMPFCNSSFFFVCDEHSLVTRALVVAWSSRQTLLKADIAIKDCALKSEGCQPSQQASLLRACSVTVGVRVGKVQTPYRFLQHVTQ